MRRSYLAVLAALSVALSGVAGSTLAGAAEPKVPVPPTKPSDLRGSSLPRVASASEKPPTPAEFLVARVYFPADMAMPYAADWLTSPEQMGPPGAGFGLRGALPAEPAVARPAGRPASVAVIAIPNAPRLALASIPLPLRRTEAPPQAASTALAMAPSPEPATIFPALAPAVPVPAAKDRPGLVAAPVPLPPKRPTRLASAAPPTADTRTFESDVETGLDDAAQAVTAGAQQPAARPVFVGKPRLTAAKGPPEIEALIERHSQRYDVPASLVRRVVWRESKFDPRVRNGPYWGLMQIRVDTARGMGFRGEPADLLDANTNMTYAVAYLANAWRVSGRNETRAVSLYAGGYYFEAKRRGLLGALIKTASID